MQKRIELGFEVISIWFPGWYLFNSTTNKIFQEEGRLMQTVSWTRKSAKCFTRNVESKGWGKGGANRGEELDGTTLCWVEGEAGSRRKGV